jgi:hypothetical protein
VFLTASCTAVLSCNLLKLTFLPDCPADLAPAVLGVAGAVLVGAGLLSGH